MFKTAINAIHTTPEWVIYIDFFYNALVEIAENCCPNL